MMNRNRKLQRLFYGEPDVTQVSRRLIGKVLCTAFGEVVTAGLITETEAYSGRNDMACHANDGLRTTRTDVIFGPPGHAYIYLCYGIHHLFNVVTNREGLADAVLIRAIRPLEGIDLILERRNREHLSTSVTDGPGKLTSALGIETGHNGTDLLGNRIWIEDRGIEVPDRHISTGPRIGVEYAGEHAKRPWRFLLKSSSIQFPAIE